MKKVVPALVLALVLVVTSIAVPLTQANSQALPRAEMFYAKPLPPGTVPLGMQGSYLVLYEQGTGALYTFNVLTGDLKLLYYASLADISSPRMLVASKLYAIYDPATGGIILANGTGVIGTVTVPGLRGFDIDGLRMILYNSRYVVVASTLTGRVEKIYSAANATEEALEKTGPMPVVALLGIDLDKVAREAAMEALPAGRNVSLAGYKVSNITLADVSPAIVSAGFVGKDAVAIEDVSATLRLTVAYSYLKGNESYANTTCTSIPVRFGLAVDLAGARVLDLYTAVAAGGRTSLSAVVVKDGLARLVYPEDGRLASITLPVDKCDCKAVKNVYSGDGIYAYEVGGVLYVVRDGRIAAMMPAPGVVAHAYEGGKLYVIYGSDKGLVVQGAPGDMRPALLFVPGRPVGLYVYGSVVVAPTERYVYYATTDPVTIVAHVKHPYGIPVEDGSAVVHLVYGELSISMPAQPPDIRVVAPRGSELTIRVDAVAGKGVFSIVADRSKELDLLLHAPPVPGSPLAVVESKFFEAPFKFDHVVLTTKDTVLYRLPGGTDVDVRDGLIAVLRDGRYLDVYSYSLSKLFTLELDREFRSVSIRFPYIVLSGDYVAVVSATTGALLLEAPGSSYSIDPATNTIAVVEGGNVYVYSLTTKDYDVLRIPGSLAVFLKTPLLYVVTGDGRLVVVNIPAKTIVDSFSLGGGFRLLKAVDEPYFSAISYTANNESRTLLITPYGLREYSGKLVWLRYLGDAPLVHGVAGGKVAAVAVSHGGRVDVYAVSANQVLVASFKACQAEIASASFGQYFIATTNVVNSTAELILRDYRFVPRVMLLLKGLPVPSKAVAWDDMVVFTAGNNTYVLPTVFEAGNYRIHVRLTDTEGRPVAATLVVSPPGAVFSINGSGTIYVPGPGSYTIKAVREYYESATEKVTVSEMFPAANATLVLRPKHYIVHVTVRTGDGEPAWGTLYVTGNARVKVPVKEGRAVLNLTAGTYGLRFVSPVFKQVEKKLEVPKATSITMVTNRTGVMVVAKVVDEAGKPVSNATVTVVYKLKRATSRPLVLVARNGTASFIVPVNSEVTIVATAKGYRKASITITARPENEGKPVVLRLEKMNGTLHIDVLIGNRKGTADVTIVSVATGRPVASATVAGSRTFTLPLGTYLVKVSTRWAHKEYTVALTEKNPLQSILARLPPKPKPLYAKLLPYVIGAVVAAAVVVLVYKKLRQKTVTLTE